MIDGLIILLTPSAIVAILGMIFIVIPEYIKNRIKK